MMEEEKATSMILFERGRGCCLGHGSCYHRLLDDLVRFQTVVDLLRLFLSLSPSIALRTIMSFLFPF
jgi:hypothetical protein